MVNSALALPWPAELRAGTHRLGGYARSPGGPITGVRWSPDGGVTWREADLTTSRHRWSWARFDFTWQARPGDHTLMTRATDSAGDAQPDVVPFNAEAEQRMRAVVTDLRDVVVLPGIGHWTQQEAPDAVNEALLGFLKGL